MNRAEPGAQYRALAIHNAADAGQTVELAQLVAAAGGVADVWVGKLKRTALMKACHRVSESNRAHNIHLAGVLDSGGYSSPGWGSIARLNDGVLSHSNAMTSHLLCFMQGHHNTVELLLALNADPNAVDHNNQTPLHWAAYGGNVDVVKTLLRGGAKASD